MRSCFEQPLWHSSIDFWVYECTWMPHKVPVPVPWVWNSDTDRQTAEDRRSVPLSDTKTHPQEKACSERSICGFCESIKVLSDGNQIWLGNSAQNVSESVCVCVYVFVCVTSLRWLQPPCRGLPVHKSSTAQQWCWWLKAEEEDSVALVGGPPTMELDQKQQQLQEQPELVLKRASGQLVVKHR